MAQRTARARIVIGALALTLGQGCGSGSQDETGRRPLALPRSGAYQVTGVTIDEAADEQRQIAGRMVLDIEEGRYTTSFELSTLWPGGGAAATVIGTGEGTVQGATLTGRADTQLVVASVPGVDVGFAFVPRGVGARIESAASAEFFPDGSVRIEIENRPAEGEDYAPTHTLLVGYRLEDAASER